MLQSKRKLLFIAHILFMGNSLPPAPDEVDAHIISTSQKRRKVEGEGSCSRSHSWQVGEMGFEFSLPPGVTIPPSRKFPLFWPQMLPTPSIKQNPSRGAGMPFLPGNAGTAASLFHFLAV